MADERYEWLDKEAAERLLRGEPVEPADDRARGDALRLAAALEAARNLPPAGGELPGETTALAAFREAAHAGRTSGADARRTAPKDLGTKAGQKSAAWQDRLPSVLIGGGHPSDVRRPRWSRPARYGLVLSLAGCAIGGVAVASGVGMFPGPFGGQGSPLPAASVSSAASPDASASGPPSDREPSLSPSDRAPGLRTSDPSHESSPVGGPSGGGPTVGPGTGDSGLDTSGGTPRPTGGTNGEDETRRPGETGLGEVSEKAVQACREYRAGTLDRAAQRRLVEMAKNEKNLDRFCARLEGEDAKSGGSEQGGSEQGGSDSAVPDGVPGPDDGGGSEEGEGRSGSLPAISFRTAAPSGDAADDAADDASGDPADGSSDGTSPGVSADSAPAVAATAAPAAR